MDETRLTLKENCLGYELWLDGELVCLYRAREELPREESPKPCFAPIYAPGQKLVTEYRPKDHPWHTGLYFGWVHANDCNLWGGPWYMPDAREYRLVEGTHGRQVHESFALREPSPATCQEVHETLTWRDARDAVIATESRHLRFQTLDDLSGTFWTLTSIICPQEGDLTLGASRAARYSGLELRMGPPFSPAQHRDSEGRSGHANIMGQRARWCCAAGADGGAIVIIDHPDNPRHPTTWFSRANLMGAGLLMGGDLVVEQGASLTLRYGILLLADDPPDALIEAYGQRLQDVNVPGE